jgi:DNA-binding Xre family transcriptional regulator
MIDEDISGRTLAKRLGISPKYMSQILNDKAPGLTAELLVRLCEELDLSLDELLEHKVKATS